MRARPGAAASVVRTAQAPPAAAPAPSPSSAAFSLAALPGSASCRPTCCTTRSRTTRWPAGRTWVAATAGARRRPTRRSTRAARTSLARALRTRAARRPLPFRRQPRDRDAHSAHPLPRLRRGRHARRAARARRRPRCCCAPRRGVRLRRHGARVRPLARRAARRAALGTRALRRRRARGARRRRLARRGVCAARNVRPVVWHEAEDAHRARRRWCRGGRRCPESPAESAARGRSCAYRIDPERCTHSGCARAPCAARRPACSIICTTTTRLPPSSAR